MPRSKNRSGGGARPCLAPAPAMAGCATKPKAAVDAPLLPVEETVAAAAEEQSRGGDVGSVDDIKADKGQEGGAEAEGGEEDCGGEDCGRVVSKLTNPDSALLPGSVAAEANDKGKLASGFISQPQVHQEVDEKLDVAQGSGRFTGVVKLLHGDNGRVYGFIKTDNGLGDLFFDGLSIRSRDFYVIRMAEGDMVEFSVRKGVDGRKEAFDVSKPGFDCCSAAHAIGVVKCFDIQKLSGFIGSPNFKDDLFFHVNSISFWDLLDEVTVGDIVVFSVRKGVNGCNEAVDVVLGCRFDFYVTDGVDGCKSFSVTLPPSAFHAHEVPQVYVSYQSLDLPYMPKKSCKKLMSAYKKVNNPGIGVRPKPSQPSQSSPSTTEPATTDSSTTRFPARR